MTTLRASTLKSRFKAEAKSWTLAGTAFGIGLSFAIVLWIAKRAAEQRSVDIATASAMALRDKLLLGDTRGFELSSARSFRLGPGETIRVLSPDRTPMIPGETAGGKTACTHGALFCWSPTYDSVDSTIPVYFDEGKTRLIGYVSAVT